MYTFTIVLQISPIVVLITGNRCKFLGIFVSIFILNGGLLAPDRTLILFTFLFIPKICLHIDKRIF